MSIVVFFDLGDTLVVPKIDQGTLVALKVLPFVTKVLDKLKHTNVGGAPLRLGVISNTGNETGDRMRTLLQQAGLLGFFEPSLLLFSSVEHLDKTKKEFFQLAATRAGIPPAQCIYVGENADERRVAESAGFRASFHALHVFHVLGLV